MSSRSFVASVLPAILLGFLAWPHMAMAQALIPGVEGFAALVLRPLFLPDHLVALIAGGLLLGQRPELSLARALICLTVGFLLGFATLLWLPRIMGEWFAPLIWAAITGSIVALALPLNRLGVGAVVFVLGGVLGANTFPLQNTLRSAVEMVAATLLAAMIVTTVVGGIAARLNRGWQRIGVRVLGSWIAAAAIMVLALAAARWDQFT